MDQTYYSLQNLNGLWTSSISQPEIVMPFLCSPIENKLYYLNLWIWFVPPTTMDISN